MNYVMTDAELSHPVFTAIVAETSPYLAIYVIVKERHETIMGNKPRSARVVYSHNRCAVSSLLNELVTRSGNFVSIVVWAQIHSLKYYKRLLGEGCVECQLLNSIQLSTQTTESRTGFKKIITQQIKTQYKSEVTCNNPRCPDCRT